MKLEHLKYVRVGVSLLFLVLTAIVFLDFTNLVPPSLVGGILFLQFVPSALKFATLLTAAAAGFAIVLLLTLLFGRVYCSSICPLGTLQDVIGYVARRFQKKFYRVSPPQNLLRYSLLALTLLGLLFGSGLVLNLLDPFSTFGRIFTNLVRPVVLGANNAGAWLTEKAGLYWLYRVEIKNIGPEALIVPLLMLGMVVWLAATRGRLYCNTFCPVGALLSLVSRRALVRIAIDEGDCKGCGLCEKVCKSECIDRKAKTVDFDRCVACFNCFDVCPRDGMMFRTPWRKARSAAKPAVRPASPPRVSTASRQAPLDKRRRQVILGPLLALAAWQGLPQGEKKKAVVATKESTVPVHKTSAVSPPGSRSIEQFTSTCTACHLCVSACPTRVLAPAFLQYGLLGILQPTMEFESGYCNYDCVVCSEVCPTGAILPIGAEEKRLSQLGIAKFVKENCIVETEGTDCGACSEHCPTKAVNMVPFKGKLVIPEVKSEYCIGCGACEHACPTKPYKAIYVDGNPVHLVAKKAETRQIEQKVDYKEEFPF